MLTTPLSFTPSARRLLCARQRNPISSSPRDVHVFRIKGEYRIDRRVLPDPQKCLRPCISGRRAGPFHMSARGKKRKLGKNMPKLNGTKSNSHRQTRFCRTYSPSKAAHHHEQHYISQMQAAQRLQARQHCEAGGQVHYQSRRHKNNPINYESMAHPLKGRQMPSLRNPPKPPEQRQRRHDPQPLIPRPILDVEIAVQLRDLLIGA